MSIEFNKVCVIGLGYIGLPTAAVIASKGVDVLGVDIKSDVVDVVNSGSIHIVEPNLSSLVKSVVDGGALRASTSPESSDAYIIAVPTPFILNADAKIPSPDLSYIWDAARAISVHLKIGDLVVLESTSPVGTTEMLSALLAKLRPDLVFPHDNVDASNVYIAYCPERVLPGNVLTELVNNDRTIGGVNPQSSLRAKQFYKLFVQGDCHVSSARTAELCKLTENSFRDVNIAFANELSFICDELDVNVWELIRLANCHPRVNILQPGPGVGGHCIAVDPWFIVSSSPKNSRLISTARIVNDSKPAWVIGKINDAVNSYVENNSVTSRANVKIACFGLSFKPNIDDLRESPSLEIVSEIAESHPGQILVVQPNIQKLPDVLSRVNVSLVECDVAINSADIFVILVGHTEFLGLDFLNITDALIVDCCGLRTR